MAVCMSHGALSCFFWGEGGGHKGHLFFSASVITLTEWIRQWVPSHIPVSPCLSRQPLVGCIKVYFR